jgi:hypothetical protein
VRSGSAFEQFSPLLVLTVRSRLSLSLSLSLYVKYSRLHFRFCPDAFYRYKILFALSGAAYIITLTYRSIMQYTICFGLLLSHLQGFHSLQNH